MSKEVNTTENSPYIDVAEAIKLAGELGINISNVTVMKWAEQFKLGHQPGGRGSAWYIHREKWVNHLNKGEGDGENQTSS
jgi:hypothetical protein